MNEDDTELAMRMMCEIYDYENYYLDNNPFDMDLAIKWREEVSVLFSKDICRKLADAL